MARIKAFVEVPHESRTDWATFKQVAEKLGLRLNQVTGWARSGHIVSCKVKGRRFISLSECQEYKTRAHLQRPHTKKRSRSKDTKTQEPQPQPQPEPIRCEIVPVDVAGHQLVGARLDGQEVIAVRLLEELLGLVHGSLARKMRRRDDFIEGVHMFNLNAEQLSVYLSGMINLSVPHHREKTTRLTVLTAAGVSMALMLGNSDICRRLRQELSTSGFMQSVGESVRDQDAGKFARTLAGDQQTVDLEQFRRDMITETRQIVQEAVRDAVQVAVRESMQSIIALLPELMAGIQPQPTKATSKQHRCNMRGETVARLIRQNVLGVKMTANGVHDLAKSIEQKRLGFKDNGSGLEGYSELRNTGGTYDARFYSPAMVTLMCDIMRNGQIYMGFVQ